MSTTLLDTDFSTYSTGPISGVTAFSGATFTVGTTAPISPSTKSYGTTTAADGQVVLFTQLPSMTNGSMVVAMQIPTTHATCFGPILRADSSFNNAYLCAVSAGGVSLFKRVAGTFTNLNSAFFNGDHSAYSSGILWVRFDVEGSTIRYRHWANSDAEPTTWDYTTTDTAVTQTGYSGFYLGVESGGPTTAALGHATVVSNDATPPPLAEAAPTAGTITSTSIVINWTTATGGTGIYTTYDLQRLDGSGWTDLYIGSAQTYTDSGRTASTAYTYRVVVVDSSNTIVGSPSAVFTTASTPPPASTTFAADATGFAYYGRWHVASGKATTINAGSLVEFGYTGDSCVLGFDVSGLSVYPDVITEVDGGGRVRTSLSSTTTTITLVPQYTSSTTPAATAHRVRLWAAGIFEGVGSPQSTIDEWNNQAGALKFTGITLGSGKALLPVTVDPNQIEFLGDSITASVRLKYTGSASDQSVMDGSNSWPAMTAALLGLKPSIVGFGGTGLTVSGSGNVPACGITFGYSYAGTTYSATSKPAVVVIALGTNDQNANPAPSVSTYQVAYSAYLSQIRTAYPKAIIFAVTLNTSSTYDLALVNAVAAGDANMFHLNYSGNTVYAASGDTVDGTHPNPGGAAKIASQLAADIQTKMNTLSIGYQAPTGYTPQQVANAVLASLSTATIGTVANPVSLPATPPAGYGGSVGVSPAQLVSVLGSGVTTLAPTGLDAIPSTIPGAGKAATFPQMVVQVWRRYFWPGTLTSGQLTTLAADGTTVLTTQTVTNNGTVQTQGMTQ